MHLPQLKRIRWAVRLALFLGVAASIAANVLHAQPNIISQVISAWPPLALLLTVELTSRIPMHKPLLAALRVAATTVIAGIAAWVSYWHMQDVALRYGETATSSYLLPISVDGLIVVASVCLVELAGRIRTLEDEATAAAAASAAFAPSGPSPMAQPVFRPAMPAFAGATTAAAPVSPAVGPVARPPAYANGNGNGSASSNGNGNGSARPSVSAAVSTPTRTVVTASTGVRDTASPREPRPESKPDTSSAAGTARAPRPATESSTPRQRRPVLETADLADEIEAMHPEISETELARRLGITATRLRAVRREAREARRAAAAAAAAE